MTNKEEMQAKIWRTVYARIFGNPTENYTAGEMRKKLEKPIGRERGELRFFFSDSMLYRDSVLAYQYLPNFGVFDPDGGFNLPHYIATQDKRVLDTIGFVVTQLVNLNSELPNIVYVVRDR